MEDEPPPRAIDPTAGPLVCPEKELIPEEMKNGMRTVDFSTALTKRIRKTTAVVEEVQVSGRSGRRGGRSGNANGGGDAGDVYLL